jgi:hypothetical protein
LPHLQQNFDEKGQLVDKSILRIQKLWEDSTPANVHLQVTEVGLLSLEKQSAFSEAYQQKYSSDIKTNAVSTTYFVKCILSLLQGIPSKNIFNLDSKSLTFSLDASFSLSVENSDRIKPC